MNHYFVVFFYRKLTEYYEFIDKKRVGIWGWSYGGFAAGMALAADNSSVLRCAASVAPVTDWIYYGIHDLFRINHYIYVRYLFYF